MDSYVGYPKYQKLSARETIQLTLEQWHWLARTGAPRMCDWPGLRGLPPMQYDNPLCEYAFYKMSRAGFQPQIPQACEGYCLYYREFGMPCEWRKSSYSRWAEAETVEDKRHQAGRFLEKLKELA